MAGDPIPAPLFARSIEVVHHLVEEPVFKLITVNMVIEQTKRIILIMLVD